MAADEQQILTHDDVLRILSRQAEEGSVTAAASLERALRARAKDEVKDEVGDAIDQILKK